MFLENFFNSIMYYFAEIMTALIVGFFLSGLIHVSISDKWIDKHLGNSGIKSVLYSTIIGTLAPVCCWGSLPIAITFYKKGAPLGPIFAILIATPATSINALIITAKLLGIKFAIYLFFSVIIMGIIAGLIGNKIKINKIEKNIEDTYNCNCESGTKIHNGFTVNSIFHKILAILKYAYIDLPREIWKETLIGIFLAALINSAMPVGMLIKNYLAGNLGYLFALIFGPLTYMCATMGVPIVDAFIKQGLNIGAGFVLLLVGPITSLGTILVLIKEFGVKVVSIYLSIVFILSLILGVIYSFI